MERTVAFGAPGVTDSSHEANDRTRWSYTAGFLASFVVLGFVLRLFNLGYQPLWWDEGYSVWFATHSLSQMAALTAEDIHPPLYYAILHGWTLLAGARPIALRLLSVTAGTAAIPLAYVAGRAILGSRRAGLLAAFLVAINPMHVYYSQEVRMYGLMALFSFGILLAAWRSFTDSPRAGARLPLNVRALLAYVVLTTAALYTQYYAIFLPAGLTLFAAWLWRRDGQRLLAWLGAQAAVAFLYLPWVLYAAPRLVLYVNQKVVADDDRPLGLVLYLGRHLSAFAAGHLEGPLADGWPLALLLLAPLVLGLALRRRGDSPSPVAYLLTVLATALVLGWLIGLRYPFFPQRGERLLLLALPSFVLAAAAALDALAGRLRLVFAVSLGLFVVASAASLAAFYTVPRYAGEDYRPLVARTVEQGLPADTVFAIYPWQVGYWRSYGSVSGPNAVLTPSDEFDPAVRATLDRSLASGRIWFPAHLALGAILETQVEDYLAERGVPVTNEWYGPGTRLSGWAAAQDLREPVQIGAQFAASGGPVTLEAVSAAARSVGAANEVLPLALHWRAPAGLSRPGVSVRLVDDLAQIWAQHDYEPAGATATTGGEQVDRLGLLVGAGTPPGQYHLEVALSQEGGATPLQVTLPGEESSNAARIFDVDVRPAERVLEPERAPVGVWKQTELDNGIRFLGYSADPEPLTPGDSRRVNLFWQATGSPAADFTAFVQLLDRGGAPIAGWEAPPGAAWATSQWTPGALVRTQAAIRAPATLPDGRYRLITGLFRASDGVRARTANGRDAIEIGTIEVIGRAHDMTAPAPRFPTDATFGGAARLTGYDLPLWEVTPAPGESIPLTLHWQALASTAAPYTVFVHLVDENGKAWGYGDSEPGNGSLPTTGWVAGEYLVDEHLVTIAPDAPPGQYRLAVGLYDPATGERLATPDGADQVLLNETITVRSR